MCAGFSESVILLLIPFPVLDKINELVFMLYYDACLKISGNSGKHKDETLPPLIHIHV